MATDGTLVMLTKKPLVFIHFQPKNFLSISCPNITFQFQNRSSGCHTVNNASKQITLFAVLLHVSHVTATETSKRVSKLFL
jgi:hypothetical protein